MAKDQLSKKEIEKIPARLLLKLIMKAKEYLKKDKVMKEVCADYGEDVGIIDYIPTMFGDIDVSAKTDHGIVILSYKLLKDKDFFKDYSYLVHEYNHYFQQCWGEKPTKGSDEGDYLDNPYEKDSFQKQIEYIDLHFGENEADKYVDNLLDHHEINDSDERGEKEEELKAKI